MTDLPSPPVYRWGTLHGYVFLDAAGRPYAVINDWVCYWHPDKQWVNLRRMEGMAEGYSRALPADQAAMYGIIHTPPPQESA